MQEGRPKHCAVMKMLRDPKCVPCARHRVDHKAMLPHGRRPNHSSAAVANPSQIQDGMQPDGLPCTVTIRRPPHTKQAAGLGPAVQVWPQAAVAAYAYLSRNTASLRPSSSCSCHLPMARWAASVLLNLTVPKPCG